MKFSKACKALPALTDTRYPLPFLDVAGKRLLATDGRAVAVIPVDVDDDDTSGTVDADAFKRATKLGLSRQDAVLGANGCHRLIDGSTMPRPQSDLRFPLESTDSILRDAHEGELRIGINADLLAKLAKALGSERVELRVTIEERKGKQGVFSAMEVLPIDGIPGAKGAIMPVLVD